MNSGKVLNSFIKDSGNKHFLLKPTQNKEFNDKQFNYPVMTRSNVNLYQYLSFTLN